jgi:hypothetical protein
LYVLFVARVYAEHENGICFDILVDSRETVHKYSGNSANRTVHRLPLLMFFDYFLVFLYKLAFKTLYDTLNDRFRSGKDLPHDASRTSIL